MREVAPTASHFPDAFVRLFPNFLEVQKEGAFQCPSRVASREAGAARDVKGVEHFTIDIELELSDGAVTDSDRSRAFVARQPRNFEFLEPPFARHTVENLQIVWRPGDGAQEPLVPRLRFVENARANQRIKGERRVPKPAISIVPIARAPELFGQRRRRGRDNAAGLPMRQRLQGQKRAKNRLAPMVRWLESRRPSGPEGMDLFVRLCERLPRQGRRR